MQLKTKVFDVESPSLNWKPMMQTFNKPASIWKSWLMDSGSLTKRLVKKSEGQFRVEVIEENWCRVSSPSLLALFGPCYGKQIMWSRKVLLIGKGEPWVTAHTLVPAASLHSPLKQVKSLQTKPLGGFLFRNPLLHREQFEVARTESGWGRRSFFRLYGHPLLVAEFFLPSLLEG